MTQPKSGIGVLDALAVGLIVAGVLAMWAFQLFVVPSFSAMFADFGSAETLPAITRLALGPVVVILATLATLALMALGLALRLSKRSAIGAALLVLAAMVPAATVPLMLAAMYAPIYMIAGNVRAD